MKQYYTISANWWTKQLWNNIEETSSVFEQDMSVKNAISMFEKHLENIIKNGVATNGVILISPLSIYNILIYELCTLRLNCKEIPKNIQMRITQDIITLFNGINTEILYSRAEDTI